MVGMSADFDGTVVSISGRRVTFRVDRVRHGGAAGTGHVPAPGRNVVVSYEKEPEVLVRSRAYRIRAWFRSPELTSQIAYAFHGDCGSGAGTTAVDGASLGPSRPAGGPGWPAVLVVIGVAAASFLGVHALVARHQDRSAV